MASRSFGVAGGLAVASMTIASFGAPAVMVASLAMGLASVTLLLLSLAAARRSEAAATTVHVAAGR